MENLGNLSLAVLLAKAARCDEVKENRKRAVYRYRETHLVEWRERAKTYAKTRYHQKKAQKAAENQPAPLI